MTTPIWHPVVGRDRWHEVDVLADEADHVAGRCIAIVETFGYGWYATRCRRRATEPRAWCAV